MASLFSRTFSRFFWYPPTLAVLGTILLTHSMFYVWFAPTIFLHSLAVVIDGLALVAWIYLSIASRNFLEFHSRYVTNQEMRRLRTILDACPQAFKNPALQCVDIIQKITNEFADQDYHDELDLLMSNLHKLAHNHKNLSARAEAFGTAAQKQRMVSLLNQQTASITNTLQTLMAFSGNLAILSANLEQHDVAAKELKFMSQGLQEVIQELDDAKQ